MRDDRPLDPAMRIDMEPAGPAEEALAIDGEPAIEAFRFHFILAMCGTKHGFCGPKAQVPTCNGDTHGCTLASC
jgi:hypothetical protein